MIITTIRDVPGMETVEYRGLATGEVVAGNLMLLKILEQVFETFLVDESKGTKMKLFKQELKL